MLKQPTTENGNAFCAESVGWNIYRIWTIDWRENSDKIIDTIIEK
jgi:very-short-patch-repair endonuclease